MKERAAELRTPSRRGKAAAKAAAEAQDVLDTIAELPDEDRVLAEQVHAVITARRPRPGAEAWYGMPACDRRRPDRRRPLRALDPRR